MSELSSQMTKKIRKRGYISSNLFGKKDFIALNTI